MEINSNKDLNKYAAQLNLELQQILSYWASRNSEKLQGGVVGNPKNNILGYARVLWVFSAAYNSKALKELKMANWAYNYIVAHFIDIDYGGLFWTVDHNGNPKDTKKQVHALAFTLNSFSEYFMACGDELVREHAIVMQQDLLKYCHDQEYGGYFEVFDRNWVGVAKKALHTQLNVLEGFTNLYRIWPDEELKIHLLELFNDFSIHLINGQNGLFFGKDWMIINDKFTYNLNLAASWLLPEAAKVIANVAAIGELKILAVKIVTAALPQLVNGGPELSIAFFNAWQITADQKFLNAAIESSISDSFLDSNIKDPAYFYQKSRACIEISNRIKSLDLS